MAIRKGKVEQYQRRCLFRKIVQRERQAIDRLQPERRNRLLLQHFLDEADVAGIVLDKEDRGEGTAIHSGVSHFALGRVTMVSQNWSIDLITCRNLSRSTGLVTKQLACSS